MRTFLISLALLAVSGCSLIEIRQGGDPKKPIPMKPQVSRKLEETLRQEAQLAYDAAVTVHNKGTEAESRESKILLTASDKVLTFTGKPATPLEIPDAETGKEKAKRLQKEIDALHKAFEKQLTENRDAERHWEDTIMYLKEQQQALETEANKWKLTAKNLKFWFWILVGGIVVLCIVFPSLIPVFVRWGKKGVQSVLNVTKRQMREVVRAVEEVRNDPNLHDEAKARIDENLGKFESADTQAEIAKIKKENSF